MPYRISVILFLYKGEDFTICVSLFGFELIDLKVCQVLLRDTCT